MNWNNNYSSVSWKEVLGRKRSDREKKLFLKGGKKDEEGNDPSCLAWVGTKKTFRPTSPKKRPGGQYDEEGIYSIRLTSGKTGEKESPRPPRTPLKIVVSEKKTMKRMFSYKMTKSEGRSTPMNYARNEVFVWNKNAWVIRKKKGFVDISKRVDKKTNETSTIE